jgi:hypothetical protein
MRGEGIWGRGKLRNKENSEGKRFWGRGFERAILGGGEIRGVLRGKAVEGKLRGSNFGVWKIFGVGNSTKANFRRGQIKGGIDVWGGGEIFRREIMGPRKIVALVWLQTILVCQQTNRIFNIKKLNLSIN